MEYLVHYSLDGHPAREEWVSESMYKILNRSSVRFYVIKVR